MPRRSRAERNEERERLFELIVAHPRGVGREALAGEYHVRFGTRIEWRFEDRTLWLSQTQLAAFVQAIQHVPAKPPRIPEKKI